MAGPTLGAAAPAFNPARTGAPSHTTHDAGTPRSLPVAGDAGKPRSLVRIPASSRTRRNHGVFLLGDELASVYSSRREADGLGVTMSIGGGAVVLTGSMTPTQARAMAKALTAAAEASECRALGTAVAQGGAA